MKLPLVCVGLALFACSTPSEEAREPQSESEAAEPQEPQEPTTAPEDATLLTIGAEEIQAHVDVLASDELAGRFSRSEEGHQAAAYVAEAFERAGLEPAGDDATWFQAPDDTLSPNVVGRLPGSGTSAIVLTAHYDHLEPRDQGEDRIFNGADDNASGTAVVIELAEAFAARARAGEWPEHTLYFVAFTAEEIGMVGSRHFVANLPVAKDAVIGNINLDMVSRGEEDLVFCEPGANSQHLREAAEAANQELGELRVRFGAHPEWVGQSDQISFLREGIPAIYFGVEDHEDYHRVTDHADRILPELAARVGRLVERMVGEL